MPRPRPFVSGTSLIARVLVLGLAAGLARGPVVRGADLAKATFAGGCFWCMEKPFEDLPGVVSVTSGYSGGQVKKPTYEQVSMGVTGHAESVQVVYDPAKVTYAQLLDVFWHNIDPVSAGGQFCDRGSQYRSAIFYHTPKQKEIAERRIKELNASKIWDASIVTQVVPAQEYFRAEDYHQGYFREHPEEGYCQYVVSPKVAKFRKHFAAKLRS